MATILYYLNCIALTMLGIAAFLAIVYYSYRYYRFLQWVRFRAKLGNLPFFHCLCVGGGEFHLVTTESGEEVRIWSDTPFLLVIKKDQQVLGQLGFDTGSRCLVVRQVQGLKGVNVRGLNLADYILACAEEVASRLDLLSVKVQPAGRNAYYLPLEDGPEYDKGDVHRRRLEKVYDDTPSLRGYVLVDAGQWREKKMA